MGEGSSCLLPDHLQAIPKENVDLGVGTHYQLSGLRVEFKELMGFKARPIVLEDFQGHAE